MQRELGCEPTYLRSDECSPSARWLLELAEKLNNYLNILRIGKSSQVRLHPLQVSSDATDPKERCRRAREKRCMFGKTPLLQNRLPQREPSGAHFELLVAVDEGARPVTTPIANPPSAPARIPIRIRDFGFSRMEVLCLMGGSPNWGEFTDCTSLCGEGVTNW
jgi:hypothetical protein